MFCTNLFSQSDSQMSLESLESLKFQKFRTEFVSDILSPAVHIEVLNTPPVVTMGLEEEKLYSGVNGKLNFTVQVGSKPLTNESMKLAATAGLEIVSTSVEVFIITF